jgi:hypothetical protein
MMRVGMRIEPSTGDRSPSAAIATIWRAVPAGRYERFTEVVKRSRR